MRLIEEQMNSAIRGQRNFRKDNTEVVTTDNGLESVVYLHGNMIAVYFHNTRELQIFDGGWQSNTTKSRLNALLDEFVPSMGIFQKNWNWFLSDRLDGSVVPFANGVTV